MPVVAGLLCEAVGRISRHSLSLDAEPTIAVDRLGGSHALLSRSAPRGSRIVSRWNISRQELSRFKRYPTLSPATKWEPACEAMNIQTEISSARTVGCQLEDLVVKRGQCPDEDRNILLMGNWALIFDYRKSILNCIERAWYGSAFALVRPVVESLVRAHVAVKGTAEDVERLQRDDYRTNLATIGGWIDTEFGSGDLFKNFLNKKTRDALHSYTHGGIAQLARRFDGHNLTPRYEDGEIIEVIRSCTSAVWMVTNLVTKHLHLDDEAREAERLYVEWGRR